MRFLKRLFCEHRLEYAGTWINNDTVGIGKYERTVCYREIVACCGKCGKVMRFDSREEFEVRKAVGEIRNKNVK